MELQHGRVSLWLRALREGEGTPLLCLHELGGSGNDFQDVLPAWPGPVFALDFSGHGRSGRIGGGSYMAELLVGDADAALERIGPSAILGRGLGAYVALLLSGGRVDAVAAALLQGGRGLAGVEVPDFDRTPDPTLPSTHVAESSALREEPATDPRAIAAFEVELRPSEYVEPFASAAKHLLFLEDGAGRPAWWQRSAEQENASRLSDLSPAAAVEKLAQALADS